MTHPQKSFPLKTLLKSVVVVLCFLLIVRHFYRNSQGLKVILQINASQLVTLFITYFIIHLMTAFKVILILKKLKLSSISFLQWLKIYTISRLANLHVTQGASIYLSIKLKKEYNYPYTNTLSLMTLFSWFECTSVLLFLTILTFLINPHQTINGLNINMLATLGLISLILIPFLAKWVLAHLNFKRKFFHWLHERLSLFTHNVTDTIQNGNLILKLSIINVLWLMVYIYWVTTVFHAIGAAPNIVYLATYTTFIILSRLINLVPGNIGVRELLGGYLGESMGWGFSEGVIVSGLIRAIEYLIIIALGLLFAKALFIKNADHHLKKD